MPLLALLFEPTSELFCRKWFRVGEEEEGCTYVELLRCGAICR